MKAAKLFACCLLVLPLVGTVSLGALKTRIESARRADILRLRLTALRNEAHSLYRNRQFIQALPLCERMHREAAAAGLFDMAAIGAREAGACQFQMHRYDAALGSFLEGRRLAESARDADGMAACDVNIVSLYSERGEVDFAAYWAQALLGRLSGTFKKKYEGATLLLLGSLRARQNRISEAEDLFARGIAAADGTEDLYVYSNAWNRLGEERLKLHRLEAAEGPLLEAYRVRKLNHLPLDTSYRNLGLLRIEQGDLASASVLLNRAVELATLPGAVLPAWDAYQHRGRLRMLQGRLPEAVEDLRIAVRLARAWRWSAPADDAARVGAEGWLEKVHSALVEAGNRLYLETHDPAFLRETFEAAEENRANSLRWLLASRGESPSAKLPPAYWEALARLQRAEITALHSNLAHDQEHVAAIRAELARMEVPLGREGAPLPVDLLERTRAALPPDAALLSFHLGEASSWLWALDRQGLALYRLPPRRNVEELARAASDAMRADGAHAEAISGQLYRTLFGKLDSRFQQRSRWLVALDRGLFEVPIAALRKDGQYVTELHTVELIPGAGAWVEANARPAAPGTLFVGVGDAIYNTADPRLTGHAAAGGRTRPLLLPRLVGSAREIEGCARTWNGERVLLEGESASRANLVRQLARDPAVVHLATHVLQSGGEPTHGLIALSLNSRRENELLPPQEIARWRTGARVVVMSGCHSAEGPILPGTGLLGLTRAWLAAGARSVIASNWATPDESGALFGALYRSMAADKALEPASALRSAQLAMIRSGGWRARPQYWGSYFVVGTL